MRYRHANCLIVGAVLSVGLVVGSAARDLDLPNADFEEGLEHWTDKNPHLKTQVSEEAAYRGDYGVLVEDADFDGGSSLLSELIRVRPGDELTLTFYGRNVTGDSMGVYLKFFDRDEEELEVLNEHGHEKVFSTKVRSEDWEKHEYEAEVPEGAAYVAVWLHSYNSDEVVAHLDEFTLSE
ncbi:MAG: carbohydrate binding domain-containing protein [Verrucomicrobiota bacterium]